MLFRRTLLSLNTVIILGCTLVDGEGIVLQLVAQLRLEVAQLFLQHVHAHDGNVLGLQRSCGLDDQKELVGLAVVVIRRLKKSYCQNL